METICCIVDASACSNIVTSWGSDGAQMERMCTRGGREAMIESMFPDNFTACEGNCTGALEVYQGYLFVNADDPSFAEMNSDGGPSRRKIARLREYACANEDVMTCAATPDGAGYEACDVSEGTTTAAPSSGGGSSGGGPSSPTDPINLLATCEVALAVKVAMKLTVDNPVQFAADVANKIAVEAGIAAAASIEAQDVEATLTAITNRRLQASLRSLNGGNVDIDATIHTANAAAASTMVATVAAIETTAMSTAIETAFEDAGINVTITVEEIAAPETQTAVQANAAAAAAAAVVSPSPPPPQGSAGGAHQASVASVVLGILAVFAVTTTM